MENINNQIKAMKWPKTLLFFGLPGLWITLNFSFLLPVLSKSGFPLSLSTMLLLFVPLMCVFIFVVFDFIGLRKDTQIKIKNFLWVEKLSVKQIFLCLGLFIAAQGAELLLSPSRELLIKLPLFNVPEIFPELFAPNYEFKIPLETFLGMKLKGDFLALLFWAIWLVLNIGLEEILWRGYALKRMELYFGKYAWLVNGLLWNLSIHFFMRWSFIGLLPVSLLVPFICQKTKSLWPGVIIHGTGNLLVFILLIPSVFA